MSHKQVQLLIRAILLSCYITLMLININQAYSTELVLSLFKLAYLNYSSILLLFII